MEYFHLWCVFANLLEVDSVPRKCHLGGPAGLKWKVLLLIFEPLVLHRFNSCWLSCKYLRIIAVSDIFSSFENWFFSLKYGVYVLKVKNLILVR